MANRFRAAKMYNLTFKSGNIGKKSCCICGVIKNPTEPVSYHRFPKNKIKSDKWFKTFDIDSASVRCNLEYIRLCSRHFKSSDFCDDSNNKIRKLRSEAVPSIKLIEGNNSYQKRLCLAKTAVTENQDNKDIIANKTGNSVTFNKSRTCIICRRKNKDMQLSFYTFPKDERRSAWLAACQLDSVMDNMYLCSRHFEPNCFLRIPGLCRRSALKKTAVPTLLLSSPKIKKEPETLLNGINSIKNSSDLIQNHSPVSKNYNLNEGIVKYEIDIDLPETTVNLESSEYELVEVKSENVKENTDNNSPEFPLGAEEDNENWSSLLFIATDHSYCEKPRDSTVQRKPRYPGDIKALHLSSPQRARECLDMANKVIRRLRKEVKSLHQTIRRREKKMVLLRDTVKEFKNQKFISEEIAKELLLIIGRSHT